MAAGEIMDAIAAGSHGFAAIEWCIWRSMNLQSLFRIFWSSYTQDLGTNACVPIFDFSIRFSSFSRLGETYGNKVTSPTLNSRMPENVSSWNNGWGNGQLCDKGLELR